MGHAKASSAQAPADGLWHRDLMGRRERSPFEQTRWERFEEWSERHGCLAVLLGLIGFPLLLVVVVGGAYWLGGSGTGGVFVLGVLVGAEIGAFSLDYWRSGG